MLNEKHHSLSWNVQLQNNQNKIEIFKTYKLQQINYNTIIVSIYCKFYIVISHTVALAVNSTHFCVLKHHGDSQSIKQFYGRFSTTTRIVEMFCGAKLWQVLVSTLITHSRQSC